MDVSQRITEFLQSLTNSSTSTIITYRTALARFVESGIPLDDSALAAFDMHLSTTRYNIGRRKGPYSAGSRHLYVIALHRFMEWLVAYDLAPTLNLTKAVARLHVGRGSAATVAFKPRMPDPDLPAVIEYVDALATAPGTPLEDLRDCAFIRLLFDTGCRVSEARDMLRADVLDGRAREVWVVGKGEKGRWLFLGDATRNALERYCKARHDVDPHLFINHSLGVQLSKSMAYLIVKRAARACGLASNTSPHSFRHWRAIQLLNAGMPLESVQAFLGHMNIETTRHFYAQTLTSELRKQIEKYRDDKPLSY